MSPSTADVSPAPSAEEANVPPELRGGGSVAARRLAWVGLTVLLIGPAVLYFGFFGVLTLDAILETNYLDPEKMPEGYVDAIRFVYAPLIYAIDQFS